MIRYGVDKREPSPPLPEYCYEHETPQSHEMVGHNKEWCEFFDKEFGVRDFRRDNAFIRTYAVSDEFIAGNPSPIRGINPKCARDVYWSMHELHRDLKNLRANRDRPSLALRISLLYAQVYAQDYYNPIVSFGDQLEESRKNLPHGSWNNICDSMVSLAYDLPEAGIPTTSGMVEAYAECIPAMRSSVDKSTPCTSKLIYVRASIMNSHLNHANKITD